MTGTAQIPEETLHVALYDKEFGELDFRLFNAHTGRQETPNPWIRFHPAPFESRCAVYTDRMLSYVESSSHPVNIAWLLESPELMRKPHCRLRSCEGRFDAILTFEKPLLQKSEKYIFCPMGGSWIPKEEWMIHPKNKNLSIICSKQNYLSGHKLRFEVIRRFGSFIDGIYGSAFHYIERKIEGLRDYRFSLAIENCRTDFYFTEKLIDCFATGTVPIYWGCPSIGNFFDPNGILSFKSIGDLTEILNQLSPYLYESMMPAIIENHRRAINYRCVEKNIRALLSNLSFHSNSP